MSEEVVLVASSGERIISRVVGDEDAIMTERWELSDPVPGTSIINSWQIYRGIWLVLARDEEGRSHLYRSLNLSTFSLVHSRDAEVHNLFWVDDGHALISAGDGWLVTVDAGVTWAYLPYSSTFPVAKAAVIVPISDLVWRIVAYGQDHKIYAYDYAPVAEPPYETVPEYDSWAEVSGITDEPDLDEVVPEYESWGEVPVFPDLIVTGDWSEVYDASGTLDKWYPAIAGSAVGVLAGVGKLLLKASATVDDWQQIQELPGYIKSIVVSNQSRLPTFAIVVEVGDENKVYWTYDLGDSVMADLTRAGAVVSVQSVIPTGTNEQATSFAVVGQKTPGQATSYKIVVDE